MATATYHLKGLNSTGPAGMMITFTASDASSDADAKTVAQSVSTLFGVDMVVYKEGSASVVATKTPGSQGGTVSSPSAVVMVCGT